MIDLKEVFDKYDDEYLREGAHPRDLAAFNKLNALCPGRGDIVACAEHDEIWLNTDCEKLAEVASEEDVRELRRLGVMYDEGTDSLHMFV